MRWEIKLTVLGRLIWACPFPLPRRLIEAIPADWLGTIETAAPRPAPDPET